MRRGSDTLAVDLGKAACAGMAGAVLLACPIQRPPVPAEYYDFRASLAEAVEVRTASELRDRPSMQSRLYGELPELAADQRTDSLVAKLRADSMLARLGDAVAGAIAASLEADEVGGGVRDAYRKRDGQRLAVDAVVIGLGRALRRLGFEPDDQGGARNSGVSARRTDRHRAVDLARGRG